MAGAAGCQAEDHELRGGAEAGRAMPRGTLAWCWDPGDGAPGWDRTNQLFLALQVLESQAELLLWGSGLVRQLPLFPDRLADQAPGTAVLLIPSTSAASSELLSLVFDDLPIEIKRKKKS